MLKNALVWILSIGIGYLGFKYGLPVFGLALAGVALLAIFVPVISKRRKSAKPLEQEV